MVGGTVVQVVARPDIKFVEVLCETRFDRLWRTVRAEADVRVHDRLWWQSRRGYLTRPKERAPEFVDRDIGPCRPACSPWEYDRRTPPDEAHETPGATPPDH